MDILMNKDKEVLVFDLDEYFFKVIDNSLLPYSLKDYLRDSQGLSAKKLSKYRDAIRTFFTDRTLSISRLEYKAIMTTANFSVKLTEDQRCDVALKCRGISVTDSYWVKKEDENLKYDDVNVRKKHLSEMTFVVSVLGKSISLERELIKPDIMTGGMYPKTWVRRENELFLAKSDKLNDKNHVKCEVQMSKYLDQTNVNHVSYFSDEIQDTLVSMCKCITGDDVSLVDAEYIKIWCDHKGENFLKFVEKYFLEDFSKMAVCDYIFANTDRHLNNWGFMVDANTNEILSLAPLYDHNMGLISDILGNDVSELIYPPTDMTMYESAKKYFPLSNLEIVLDGMPEKVRDRYHRISRHS